MKNKSLAILIILLLNLSACDIFHKETYEELTSKVTEQLKEGNNEKAAYYGEKALLINSADPDLHFRLALLYYDMWSESKKMADEKRMTRELLDLKHTRPRTKENKKKKSWRS